MEKTFGPKLGLSATPEREGVFGGNEETEKKDLRDEVKTSFGIKKYNLNTNLMNPYFFQYLPQPILWI